MAIVKKYPSKVKTIHKHINGVYTLELESLAKPFKYEPGQFLHLALDEYDPAGQWPDSRCFSMQSAPREELIKISFAVKGQFTNRMQLELKPDKMVTLKLPYGNLFTREHNKIDTVFIAGGTGITPYLSLATDLSFASYIKPTFYAGFRNKEMNFYHDQIRTAQKINPGLEVQIVYQDKDGILDIEKIYQQSSKCSSFFISGPPKMIRIFKSYLLERGIADNQVNTDDWE